jgi:O-acetyl-ADP-ribose deacetylase (regulator of RNase III)
MKNISFGNIVEVQKGIIVQGCNAQGVMGSGVAKALRERYPAIFTAYKGQIDQWNAQGVDPLGKVTIFMQKTDLFIANAITQRHFGKDGKRYVSYKAIAECFAEVALVASELRMDVHYPLIGAGLGGGEWPIISEIIEGVFAKFPTVNHTLWIQD